MPILAALTTLTATPLTFRYLHQLPLPLHRAANTTASEDKGCARGGPWAYLLSSLSSLLSSGGETTVSDFLLFRIGKLTVTHGLAYHT